MLNITFKVDPDIIARQCISQKNRMPKAIANELWDKYKTEFCELKKYANAKLDNNEIIKELQKTEYFKQILAESKANLQKVESQWKESRAKINEYLQKTFKKSLALNCTAYIVSPKLCIGTSIGNNCFVWGHTNAEADPSYNLVYLLHESLHSYFENGDITHAIIENIADVGLAKLLGGKLYATHEYLKETHKQIDKDWKEYLKSCEQSTSANSKYKSTDIDQLVYLLTSKYV